MATSLTQPILNRIVAFDATKTNTITFNVRGGRRVYGNRLVIKDSVTSNIVYNKIQEGFQLEHVVAADSLTNGESYNAYVYTRDEEGNESAPSEPLFFKSHSPLILRILNIPEDGIISTNTYEFIGSYYQAEGEVLNDYKFTLYEIDNYGYRRIVADSGKIYYASNPSLRWTFAGMENGKTYYIGFAGMTTEQVSKSIDPIRFKIEYSAPELYNICNAEPNCEEGYNEITSDLVVIDGVTYPEPPFFIANEEIDLKRPRLVCLVELWFCNI